MNNTLTYRAATAMALAAFGVGAVLFYAPERANYANWWLPITFIVAYTLGKRS